MKFNHSLFLGSAAFFVTCGIGHAAVIINAPMPITHLVQVQPIIVQQAASEGGATATHFGTAAQQAIIEAHIDTLWAQAGR